MGLAKVWVYGEGVSGDSSDGPPSRVATITLEMLAKAREISDNVEVIFGGDASGVVGQTNTSAGGCCAAGSLTATCPALK